MSSVASVRPTGRADVKPKSTTTTTPRPRRGRTPTDLGIVDEIASNLADEIIEIGWERYEPWDEDDFSNPDSSADQGEPDDDEPYGESDERSPLLPAAPGIVFWNGPEGEVEWEVRPVSSQLLDDLVLANDAVERHALVDRYAAGLARDLLSGIDLNSPLATIWAALKPMPAKSTQDARLLADWKELTAAQQAELAPDGLRLAREKRDDAVGLELRWGVYESSLSKDHDLLVELSPDTILPLNFFTWKSAEADDLLTRMLTSSRVDIMSVSKAELKRELNTTSPYAGLLLDWVRAVKAHPAIVARYRTLFLDRPSEYEMVLGGQKQISPFGRELREAELTRLEQVGARPLPPLEIRNAGPVLCRALVGGIE